MSASRSPSILIPAACIESSICTSNGFQNATGSGNAACTTASNTAMLSTATWKHRFIEPVRFNSNARPSGPKNVSAIPTKVPVITAGASE